MSELMTVLLGTLCGIGASIVTTVVTKKLEERKQNQSVRNQFARPIWRASTMLEHRLQQIINKLDREPEHIAGILNWRDQTDRSIEWMNGHGYYIVSTAYLLSRLSCWFHLIERKVVFLPFNKDAQAAEFSILVKQIQESITSDSPLWYHYFAGLGQILLDEEKEHPISYVEFVLRLNDSDEFRSYFHHLFHEYFYALGRGKITPQTQKALASLQKLQVFLLKSSTIPLFEYETD